MRKLLVVFLLLGLSGSAFAETAPGTRPNSQKAVGGSIGSGTGISADTLVIGSAAYITGVAVSCGSSACVLGLFDDSSASGASTTITAAKCVFELPAAANTGAYVNFKDNPIRVANGVHAFLSGTGNGAVVMTEQSIP